MGAHPCTRKRETERERQHTDHHTNNKRSPAVALGRLQVGVEAGADEADAAARGIRGLFDARQAVQVGRKLRDDDAALAFLVFLWWLLCLWVGVFF